MTRDDALRELTALLEEVGREHHAAFATTNGDDPDWPRWYAVWLEPRIGRHLREIPAAETLAEELKRLAAEHERSARGLHWPLYYARRLLEWHGAHE